jgi:CBS domain containing-hemolysin-like protein
MVPKTFALMVPEATAIRIAGPMRLSEALFAPLVVPLSAAGDLILRALRVSTPSAAERILSPEELGLVISQSTEGGAIPKRQGEILLSIFDFGEREVRHVMTPRTRIEAVPVNVTESELVRIVQDSRYSRLPVFDRDLDHVVGSLHTKDFVRWRLEGRGRLDVRRLGRKPRLGPAGMPVERLLEVFKREHGHLAIVFDEYGGTAGLVTLEDLAEEIVGEFLGRPDDSDQAVRVIEPGILVVRGDVTLLDLADYGALPEELPDVDTVGGLVPTLLGRPARRGDQVTIGGVTLTVQRTKGLSVEVVRVRFSDQAGD